MPPIFDSLRHGESASQVGMVPVQVLAGPQQHLQLGEVLNDVKGKVVLSGYDSPLYKKLYRGWRTDKREQLLQCSRDKTQRRIEILWMNF